MALDVTVGGASANSYASVAEFNAYCSEQPYLSDGTDRPPIADTTLTENLLKAATKSLDTMRCNFKSTTTTPETQRLEFPRTGLTDLRGYAISDSTIPDLVKEATYEIVLFLFRLQQNNLYQDPEDGADSISLGSSVSIQYTPNNSEMYVPCIVIDKLVELNVWQEVRTEFL